MYDFFLLVRAEYVELCAVEDVSRIDCTTISRRQNRLYCFFSMYNSFIQSTSLSIIGLANRAQRSQRRYIGEQQTQRGNCNIMHELDTNGDSYAVKFGRCCDQGDVRHDDGRKGEDPHSISRRRNTLACVAPHSI